MYFDTPNSDRIYYNFCENTKKSCNGLNGTVIGYDKHDNCHVLAGDSERPNRWSLLSKYNLT